MKDLHQRSESQQVGDSHEHTGDSAADPTRDYPIWESFNIRIEADLARYLYSLGAGDYSEGVTIAGKFHREKARGAD